MKEFILELIRYFYQRKKYWLIPIFILGLLIGSLLILSKGSVVAPFIYTIF